MVRVCSLRDVVTLTWRSTLSRDVLKRQWTYLSVYVILSYEYIFYPNAVSGFCCLVRSTSYGVYATVLLDRVQYLVLYNVVVG